MTASDYARLIDAETWAFVRATEAWYPPETASFTIAEQRAIYDRMCAAFDAPHPHGVTASDRPFGGVPCRLYTPPAAPAGTILDLHGGGLVVGGLHSHDAICAEICAATGLRLVSADYRLCPEHLHPAGLNDTLAALRAIRAAFPGPRVVAGDSSGGNLAAAAAHATRSETPGLAGQVLIYPGLGGDRTRGSYVTNAHAPMLTTADIAFYAGIRFPGGVVPPDPGPAVAPLTDPDVSGLPPTVISIAECDPQADDGPAYAARIAAAGGRAQVIAEPGLVHGWLRARHSVGRARRGFDRITGAISALAAGRWPPVPA
ncbi:MAG: alpha/beta hydrolase fold domain-containing protein [Paracoccaceae bacterium]